MTSQNSKNKKGNNKNVQTKKQSNAKQNVKKIEKKVETKKNVEKEEVKVKEVTPNVQEKAVKEKKSFSLTSKQKDLILILLVVVLLIVALFVTMKKEPELDIELPIALQGEAGFTEITYSEYEEKMNTEAPFLVVVVRDGCGYCEMYEPILEEVAGEYKIPIYYINMSNLSSEEYTALGTSNSYFKKNQGNWGTPTTLFMYGKSVIDSIPGYVDKDELVDFVKENFKVEE
ncbi:MAG: thioredoxin family protein [Bacilli bacterium]